MGLKRAVHAAPEIGRRGSLTATQTSRSMSIASFAFRGPADWRPGLLLPVGSPAATEHPAKAAATLGITTPSPTVSVLFANREATGNGQDRKAAPAGWQLARATDRRDHGGQTARSQALSAYSVTAVLGCG